MKVELKGREMPRMYKARCPDAYAWVDSYTLVVTTAVDITAVARSISTTYSAVEVNSYTHASVGHANNHSLPRSHLRRFYDQSR